MVNLMSISRDEFDPLAIAVDWLDACRTGELSALLDLYVSKQPWNVTANA
jgi:hypothetical protein